ICHGFGCRLQETIAIDEGEWRQIKAFFREPAATAAGERDQIRRAVGWFEVIAGRYTPIHRDLGKNEIPGRFESVRRSPDQGEQAASTVGQMDCIDESLNVTTFLELMEQAGLFRHHRVVERAHRRSALDQHYAGQIEEVESGTRWVVDSWFYDYGSLPYVEEATEWHDIPFLFSTSFPQGSDD
ncbi:MAG TPA: hypothetical protein VK973_11585, partial [Arenicellales bacterium]|nr:hypothetical protein [Arenicellales bacterium]